ncbi:class I SAM-dependent methyltransferase [Patescibacteria group bacterium]
MDKSFDKEAWEKNIYSKGKHLSRYPFDLLVSITVRKFFDTPFSQRRNIKVLDLGCGAGHNAKFLAENGFDVYGIDGSETVIKICKETFEKWNLKGNFIQGDFLDLPYKNDFFDLVFDRESLCANTFHNIKKTMDQIYSKLKKDGLFISFFYSSYHPDKEFGREIEPNTYDDFKEGSFVGAGKIHFLDIREILELYSRFKIENIIRHSLLETYNKPKRFIEFDEYIIIAKKIER